MSSNPFARNLENVSDPTDWNLSKIPEMTDLDSLLRCFICKEFLRAPVMTGCNHSFCSQCIRESLLSNNHCPLCDSEQFESNLKRVIQLEEVVLCYSKLRTKLIAELAMPAKELEAKSATKKRSAPTEIIEVVSDGDGDSEIELNASSSTSISTSGSGGGTGDQVVISSGILEIRKKQKRSSSPDDNAIPTRDQMVECPICSKIMSAEILQTNHIDTCLNGGVPTPSPPSSSSSSSRPKRVNGISSFFQPRITGSNTSTHGTSPGSTSSFKRKPTQDFYFKEASKHHNTDIKKLPKLDFSSLTTPRLKEKLSTLKLPTQGTRIQLEFRYNQYYVLFNSNLDSNHPVSEKILKQKLNQWEISQNQTNNSSSLFGSGVSTQNITDKNFLVSEWYRCYKGEFSRLTKAAKKSMERQKQEQESEQNNEEKVEELGQIEEKVQDHIDVKEKVEGTIHQ